MILFPSQEALEMDIDAIYKPGSALDMPKRPPWSYNMSKDALLQREDKYFKVCEKYSSSSSISSTL